MNTQASIPPLQDRRWPSPALQLALLWTLLGLIIAAYVPQMLSPLRLNFDAVMLLRMVEAHQAGRGWSPPDVGSQHPIGYPFLVDALDRVGLARPPVFVGLNIAFLALGLWASAATIRRSLPDLPGGDRSLLLLAIMTAGSWVMIKHATIPITDAAYFGVSSLALLVLTQTWERLSEPGGWRVAALLFPLALVLCAMALLTRTIGIALLPAIGWSLVGQPARVAAIARYLRGNLVALAGVALAGLVAAGVLVYFVTRTTYWLGFVKEYQGGSPLEVLANVAGYRLADLGQVLLNVPLASAPRVAHPGIYAAGLVGYGLLGVGAWRARLRISPLLAYFAAYSGIVLIWPFADPRFWLPVLPFAGAALLSALGEARIWARIRFFGVGYCAVFLVLGGAAMAVTTRISLSGARFPDVYGSGVYSDAYREAFGQSSQNPNTFPEVVRLLRRFEPRAGGHAKKNP